MNEEQSQHPDRRPRGFVVRVVITLVLVGLFAAAGLLLWKVTEVLLLIFSGVLLAVILRTAAMPITRRTKLGMHWSLTLVLALLLLICGGAVWIAAPTVTEQILTLRGNLSESAETLSNRLAEMPAGRVLAGYANEIQNHAIGETNVWKQISGIFSTTFGALSGLVVFIITGVFMAYDPRLYLAGTLRLVPLGKRGRICEVISALGRTLQGWLVGQVISMAFLFVTTWLMLALLGVPLAFILALLTGLLTFIPYLGPLIAMIPILLVAFVESPMLALYTAILYMVIQNLEGNILTPLIFQRTVALPPVITIGGQLILGGLFGVLGFVLATPLTAVALVLVQKLYVEDVLGDSMENELGEVPKLAKPALPSRYPPGVGKTPDQRN